MIKRMWRWLMNLWKKNKRVVRTRPFLTEPPSPVPRPTWIEEWRDQLRDWPHVDNPSQGVSHIIIHHSLTEDQGVKDWEGIRKYHIEHNGWDDIGYHFGIEFVEDDFRIFQGRQLDKRGAHVKDGKFNYKSVGICLVGNFDEVEPPENQWKLAIELVKHLIEYYHEHKMDIPIKNVLGHREAQALSGVRFTKSCPGKMFNMGKFREELA